MAAGNPIAEAFVRLRSDPSVFNREVQAQVNAALAKVPIAGQASAAKATTAAVAATTVATAGLTAETRRAGQAQEAMIQRSKQLTDTARLSQAGLIGLGQGAISSRLAFFGLTAAAASVAVELGVGAIKAADDLQVSLNTLEVVASATSSELERVSEVARELGADVKLPSVSAADAADAMTNLARAGLSVQDAMDGARGVLQLAAAAQTDNATAAIVTARALNAFSLAGSEATRVADLLTGSSIAGGASIEEMAVALQQSAAAAAQINVTVEDTTNALALLAKNGLAGSDAGTSLRTALLRLNPQTKEAKELVDALNISVFDQQGVFVGLPEAIDQYRSALEGLTDEQRQAALATIFGQDAFRAISILSREGASGFERIAVQAERQGIAAELAAARTSGLRGQFNALQSGSETLGIELGELATGPLTELISTLNEVVGAATVASQALKDIFQEDEILGSGFTLGDMAGFTSQASGIVAATVLLGPAGGNVLVLKKAFDALFGSVDKAGDGFNQMNLISGSLQIGLRQLRKDIQEFADNAGTVVSPDEVAAAADQLEKILSESGVAVGESFSENLQAKLGDLDPKDALNAITGLIVEATAAGKDVGDALGLAIADGLTEARVQAVTAAEQTLQAVVAAGEEAVRNAVVQAKQNALTIANTIASDFAQIIDSGPLGQQIKRLQDKLDTSNTKQDRRALNEELADARKELADAQASIGNTGPLTKVEQAEIDEFLKPFKRSVRDAEDALEDFSTEGTLAKLEEAREKQIEAVDQGIRDIIARFNAGQLSLQQVNTRLAGLLGNDIAKGKFGAAGRDLGFAFTEGFKENLAGLTAQVAALVGFVDTVKGTGQGPSVIKPGDVAAEQARKAQEARIALVQAQKDLATQLANEHKTELAVLRQIRNRLPVPKPGTSGRPAGTQPGGPDAADLTPVVVP